MIISRHHPWKMGVSEAIRLQERLARKVIREDGTGEIRRVAGADVAYKDNHAFAAVVVMTYPDLKPLEEVVVEDEALFPYIPGLLTFREGPPLIKAFSRLKERPDLILFDGQGITHPRGLGIASHLGIVLDIPSIGCAKKRLHGEEEALGEGAGSIAYIRKGETVIGAKVRTRAGVRPVYVSIGHRVSLERAIEVVLKTTVMGYRIPEPIRRAHLLASRAKRG